MALARPASETTLLHRWQVLRDLYRVLDGRRVRTPCDDVPRPKRVKPMPIGVLASTIQQVLVALEGRTRGTPLRSAQRQDYARFLMLVTTGQRPVQIMRAQLEDFVLANLSWLVRAAKGGPSHQIPLNAEMAEAVRRFVAAGAFGSYDTVRFAKVLRAHGWPRAIRPYNARHSLAIDALGCGADLGDVQALLGHTSIETTRRAYAPIVLTRQRRIAQQLKGRLHITEDLDDLPLASGKERGGDHQKQKGINA